MRSALRAFYPASSARPSPASSAINISLARSVACTFISTLEILLLTVLGYEADHSAEVANRPGKLGEDLDGIQAPETGKGQDREYGGLVSNRWTKDQVPERRLHMRRVTLRVFSRRADLQQRNVKSA